MVCPKCQVEVEPVLTQSGPHVKASCSLCGAYIKFVPQHTMDDRVIRSVVTRDDDEQCEVKLF